MATAGMDSHDSDAELDAWWESGLTQSQRAQARRRTARSDMATAVLGLNDTLMWAPRDRRCLQSGHLPWKVKRLILSHDGRVFVVPWFICSVAEVRERAVRAVESLRNLVGPPG
ncbi:MAG: hypothetical protein WKF54_11760 [Nocardioidaceae bacterium]